MKNKLTIVLSVVLSMVLTTAINLGIPAVKGMRAFDPAATSLGTAFTYQGRLERNSQPVDGVTCSFQFGLYDVDTGGSPLGGGILTKDLGLSNGLFTTTLDFGAVFSGDSRWLEIAAQCPDDTGYTTIGRQPLTATPYALYAKAIPLAGDGSATTAARSDHDHWGQSWSGTGTGLTLYGSTYGLYASSDYSDIALGGTSGDISATGSSTSRIRFYSNGDILNDLDNDNNSDSKFRVLSGDDTDAFSVDETGKVQWKTQTGYLSVPPSAFHPSNNTVNFVLDNFSIYSSSLHFFYAPIYLPQGATIKRLSVDWYDVDHYNNLKVAICRTGLAMGYVESTAYSGLGNTATTSFDYATVDNTSYSYYLELFLGVNSDLKYYNAYIEYNYSGPH